MRLVAVTALLLFGGIGWSAESRPVNEGAPGSYKKKMRQAREHRPKKYKTPKFKAAKSKKSPKAKYGAGRRQAN